MTALYPIAEVEALLEDTDILCIFTADQILNIKGHHQGILDLALAVVMAADVRAHVPVLVQVAVERAAHKRTPTNQILQITKKVRLKFSLALFFSHIYIPSLQDKSNLKFHFAKRLCQGGFYKNP